MLKWMIVTFALLGSLPAFASIIQTDSFAIANIDTGYGKLSSESAIPFGLGIGYQWGMGPNVTLGVEGAYFNNGHVSVNGDSLYSYELVPLLSLYYYPGVA